MSLLFSVGACGGTLFPRAEGTGRVPNAFFFRSQLFFLDYLRALRYRPLPQAGPLGFSKSLLP